ncbi:MAG TPA: hypothetical protein VKD71_05950 [Gemmataceae bacterium]|nr:hypothetical protein [Gemmataceae bacterium]
MRSWSISIFALVLLVGCQNKLSDSGHAGAGTTGEVRSKGTSGGTGGLSTEPFAATKKSPFDPLGPEDAPYIAGKITLKGSKTDEMLAAGFVGMGADGKPHSNSAGYPIRADVRGFVTSETFAPQLTSLTNTEQAGVAYRHVKVPPGDYLVYVQRYDVMFAYKRAKLKEGDQLTIDLTIDLSTAGDLVVALPPAQPKTPAGNTLSLIPFGADLPNLGPGSELYFRVTTVKPDETKVTVKGIPAGSYWAVFGSVRNEIQVVAGKSTEVKLSPDKK